MASMPEKRQSEAVARNLLQCSGDMGIIALTTVTIFPVSPGYQKPALGGFLYVWA
jgi:hypothetical protein